MQMGSTGLNEIGTQGKGQSIEVSDDTPIYNPHRLPLNIGNETIINSCTKSNY